MAGVTPGKDAQSEFATRVSSLQEQIRNILESETADGELQYSNAGIAFDTGGSWNASIWKRGGNALDIECRQAREETWRVLVAPVKPVWPARILDWPTPDFEEQLRDAVSTLRSSERPPSNVPPIL